MNRFDDDPEALAWARAKVERVIGQMEDFQRQATERGKDPEQWRRFAYLLKSRFIGGHGCVIAAFDERRPTLPRVGS